MSIYIKGLSLQEKFTELVIYCDGSVAVYDNKTKAFQETEAKAMEVQEHGRLVDEDDICKVVEPVLNVATKVKGFGLSNAASFCLTAVASAPTIIPSDKEEK